MTYMPVEFEYWPNFPRCDYCHCFAGMGLAGRGVCDLDGLWWWNDCPGFVDEDKLLEKWKEEEGGNG